MRARGDLEDVAGEDRAAALRGGRPVRDGAAGEVAAEPDQRDAGQHRQAVAVPEPDRRVRPDDPAPVGGVQVHRRVEGRGPVLHGRVVVRVRHRDRRHAAEAAHDRLGRGVEERYAVPEQVPRRRRHQEGALVDGEGRDRLQAGEARLELLPGVAVPGGQRRAGGPGLAGLRDVLASVVADRAARRRRLGVGERGAAGAAEEDGHAELQGDVAEPGGILPWNAAGGRIR